jgi:hypothetical protein
MASPKKQSGTPADQAVKADPAEREHAADMEAAKQALARVAAERDARAEALRHVNSGGRGGSKVSGRGQQRASGPRSSVSKSGDR